MCKLIGYSAGGLAALLAGAYLAASSGSGISAFRPTVIEPASAAVTAVDRTNKTDREPTLRDARRPAQPVAQKATLQTKTPTLPAEAREPKILEGCDPAFSPLMASAKNNFSGRCLAALTPATKMAAALPR